MGREEVNFFSGAIANPASYAGFLVGYSNTLGLVGGLCSIDYGFALMFLSVVVISRDGNWSPSNGGMFVTSGEESCGSTSKGPEADSRIIQTSMQPS